MTKTDFPKLERAFDVGFASRAVRPALRLQSKQINFACEGGRPNMAPDLAKHSNGFEAFEFYPDVDTIIARKCSEVCS